MKMNVYTDEMKREMFETAAGYKSMWRHYTDAKKAFIEEGERGLAAREEMKAKANREAYVALKEMFNILGIYEEWLEYDYE